MEAYLLVNIAGQKSAIVAQDLLKLDTVNNVHIVEGDCDLIANVKTKNLIELRESVVQKILGLKSVKRVSTLIVAEQGI